MDKILQDFGVDPLLLTAQIVNFLILLFILKRFLYKPILKMLDERKQKIADSLENAEKIEQTLLRTEEEKEKAIQKATIEAQKIIDQAKISAEQLIQEAKDRATIEFAQITQKGKEELLVEREKIQFRLKSEFANMVVLALQKVTGKILTQKDQKNLIDRSLEEIKS